jgi:transposase-like protein
MLQHVFLTLLVPLLMLALVWLSQRSRSHHGSFPSQAARRSLLPRRLKPRSPLDCPACCLASSPSSPGEPAPAPVRPWREIKSRRGAPKRVKTEGFACPNRACPYYGISDAQIHAVVSDGSSGKAERIQRWRCQACQTIFSARLHTPLSRLKTPSHRVALVLSALAEGLDLSAAERVFGIRHATITHWLVRAGAHAQSLHVRSFCQLTLSHLQLDELRTRLRSHTQVLWLWVAIDPLTKCRPVLQLGPRTHRMAQLLIHRLREQLAAFLFAPLYQRWPQCLFLCPHSSLWTLDQGSEDQKEGALLQKQ